MTIAAGLLVPDGVVLGTDSAVNIVEFNEKGEEVVAGVYDGAQKLFQLGVDKPYGVMFFGAGTLGTRSFRDLLAQFDRTLREERPPLLDVANGLLAFLKQEWATWLEEAGLLGDVPAGLGVLVGGCGEEEEACSFARLLLPPAEDEEDLLHVREPGRFLLEGVPFAAHRIIYGVDDNTLALVMRFVPEEHQETLVSALVGESAFRAAPHPVLPLREAIDYVHFLVHTTIKYHKFISGPPMCGGKVELAAITTDRGFRWVTHKSLDWCVGDTPGQTEYSPLDPHGHGR